MVRAYNPGPSERTGRIQFVDYSTRHIVVKVRGFGTIRKVKVQKGIQLGTTDKPVVVRGDTANIKRRPSGKWVAESISHKERCATDTINDDDVEVNTSNSYFAQQLSALETPFDLRFPPIEPLGQITLPEFRFPDPTMYLCGIPQCTDCAPDGYTAGMTLVLSSDAEHPLGCWKWGFRQGREALCRAQINIRLWLSNDFQQGSSVAVRGHYAYCITPAMISGAVRTTNAFLITVDMSDPDVPVIVDHEDIGEEWYFCNIRINNAGTKLYIGGQVGDPTLTTFRAKRYNLTVPSSPALELSGDIPLDSSTWNLIEPSTGGEYLFGSTPTYIGGGNYTYHPLSVVDGSNFSTVGTYATGVLNAQPLRFSPPLQCGDLVMATILGSLLGLDFTVPSAPTLLWSQAFGGNAALRLDDDHFYTTQYLVDVTSPASPIFTATSPDFSIPDRLRFLNGTVYQAGLGNTVVPYQASSAVTYSLAVPLAPETVSFVQCATEAFDRAGQRIGDMDSEGSLVYICEIGSTSDGIQLTIQTSL